MWNVKNEKSNSWCWAIWSLLIHASLYRDNEVLLKYKAAYCQYYWSSMDKVKQTCELRCFARGSLWNNLGSYRLCGLPPRCCASLLLQALFAALCSKWRRLDGGIVEEDSWQAFFKSTSPSTAPAPTCLIHISSWTVRIQRVWNKLKRNQKDAWSFENKAWASSTSPCRIIVSCLGCWVIFSHVAA